MSVFVFQSIPERYDLRKAIRPGNNDTWYATRYRSEMHPNDIVYFWMGGEEHFRGLYGWGRLTSEPYLKEKWDSHGIDVKYVVKFKHPILSRSIREEPDLAEMLIFRAPQATNFLLTQKQAKRLGRLVRESGEEAPPAGEVAA
ncbi:EVE domain-containing protein [Bradyrhizobium sp. SZCCHNS1054]|uniref:EVE domain-containing protein n=1 Tax=Bradyrhizobium sp. SZCCHNS1054 TaxID=3057301 RepID=UPI002916F7F7|nr:EVE domain-containing protein [Bradyrhizobium sp. SZCCHNS1054]